MLWDPMRRDRKQFNLRGKTGAEQPENRKENKEKHRNGEKKQEQFTEVLPVMHH
jgi:hypothetical protein